MNMTRITITMPSSLHRRVSRRARLAGKSQNAALVKSIVFAQDFAPGDVGLLPLTEVRKIKARKQRIAASRVSS